MAEEVASGRPLKTLATEHSEAVDKWEVWGVPTYIEGEEAVFVRFMERGRVDDLERTLDMLQWSRLNEFKRTRIRVASGRSLGPPRAATITSDHSSAPGSRHCAVGAPLPEVAYVDVQRRRIVGELQQRSRTSERWRVVEQVDQRHHRQDPAAARAGTPTPSQPRARR